MRREILPALHMRSPARLPIASGFWVTCTFGVAVIVALATFANEAETAESNARKHNLLGRDLDPVDGGWVNEEWCEGSQCPCPR